MKKARTLLTLLCLIPLTACVTREQADEKLANGCAAGVELFLSEGFHIKSIKKKLFKLQKTIIVMPFIQATVFFRKIASLQKN